MTPQLPRRPFRPLPPPPGGLENVRHEARRRRRRRAVLSAAGGATAATAATVALILAAEGNGLAVLKPAPLPPAGQPSPTISARPLVTPGASRSTPVRVSPTQLIATHHARKHNDATPAAVPIRHSSTQTESQPSQPTSTRLRVYRTHGTMSGVQLCSGDASSGQASIGNGIGWCEAASATKVAGGERLRFTACRDDTTGGTLTYASRREVDFAVRQNGKTIWDWGRTHPDAAGAHTRRAAADDCWNWELVWPDVRQSGRSAGHGQFTFVATTTADELSGYKPATVNFRY